VDSVIAGDRGRMLGCVSSLRASLVLRYLLRNPIRGVLGVARYYAREFIVRCTSKTLETVCIAGPDGCCKTTIIDGLMPLLRYSAKLVERRQSGPQLTLGRELLERNASADSRAEARSGPPASMAKIAPWLLEEWLSQFRKKDNLTLRIIESSCYNMFIDSGRRREGIPRWFARLIGLLIPSPDLCILLDAPAEVLPTETPGQHKAYRSVMKTRTRYIILDAGRPPASVTEEAYAAIMDTLVQRTERQLRNRF
jgi:thymidylate kinase